MTYSRIDEIEKNLSMLRQQLYGLEQALILAPLEEQTRIEQRLNLHKTKIKTFEKELQEILVGQSEPIRILGQENFKKDEINQSAGFPCFSDPEYAAKYSHTMGIQQFITTLECQVKLHLLMNKHILIPGGYFFDNPAIWSLINFSESLKDLFLSKPDKGNEYTTLIVAKHNQTLGSNDENSLDPIFRTWFSGSNGQRLNNPSSLRTKWIGSNFDFSGELNSFRQDWQSLTIRTYAEKLSLSSLKKALNPLNQIFEKSTSIETPSNRHSDFLIGIKILLDRDVDFVDKEAKKDLLKLINQEGRNQISRSEIQKYAPIAWESIQGDLIALRQSSYFKNFSGGGRISIEPNTGIKASRSIVEEIFRELEIWLNEGVNEKLRYAVAIDELSFDEVLEMRTHPGLKQSIRKLAEADSFLEPERTSYFLQILKNEWAINLLDAARQVEKLKKSGQLIIPLKKSSLLPSTLELSTTIIPVSNSKYRTLSDILPFFAHLASVIQPRNPELSAKLIIKHMGKVQSM
jgi:hypothetical protein